MNTVVVSALDKAGATQFLDLAETTMGFVLQVDDAVTQETQCFVFRVCSEVKRTVAPVLVSFRSIDITCLRYWKVSEER